MFKELKLKNLGDYRDWYVQSDTVLLADAFENFRNKCIEIYELDPAHFFSAPELAWGSLLKKDQSRIRITIRIIVSSKETIIINKNDLKWKEFPFRDYLGRM